MAKEKQILKVENDLAWATVVPFADYPDTKTKWHGEHPKARIKEEFKTIYIAEMEIPNMSNLQMIGKTEKKTVLMIIWAVIYRELS